jgi:hypothetical protein
MSENRSPSNVNMPLPSGHTAGSFGRFFSFEIETMVHVPTTLSACAGGFFSRAAPWSRLRRQKTALK